MLAGSIGAAGEVAHSAIAVSQTSWPRDSVMYPALKVCHSPLHGCKQGWRVADDSATTVSSSGKILADRSCRERRSVCVIISKNSANVLADVLRSSIVPSNVASSKQGSVFHPFQGETIKPVSNSLHNVDGLHVLRVS